jgi:hypothetical protein
VVSRISKKPALDGAAYYQENNLSRAMPQLNRAQCKCKVVCRCRNGPQWAASASTWAQSRNIAFSGTSKGAALPHTQIPSIFSRHWAESALSIFAVIIAAISLWIAIDTERTNRQLVAEAAWPFVHVYTSGGSSPQLPLTLSIANAGIGPAKIETLELFWNGKAYRNAVDVLKDCCDYKTPHSDQLPAEDIPLSTSDVPGTVLRAGDNVSILRYVLTPDNTPTWQALRSQRMKISFRICYCSIFNECWLTEIHRFSDQQGLDPPSVKMCPRPEVAYGE